MLHSLVNAMDSGEPDKTELGWGEGDGQVYLPGAGNNNPSHLLLQRPLSLGRKE